MEGDFLRALFTMFSNALDQLELPDFLMGEAESRQ